MPLLGEEIEIDELIGEDVRLVVEDVVEPPQLLVQEAGRSGRREDERRVALVDVAQRPVELPVALGSAERLLRPGRQLVDHREPDRPRELDEVGIDRPQLAEGVQVRRARIVLVEHAVLPVREPERRVTDRPVGRRGERLDHHREPVDIGGLAVVRLHERGEPALAQGVLELGRRVVRQQHGGALRDVLTQVLGVEVVAVKVRDEEVVGLPDRVPVQLRIVREGEPGTEIRRVDPRVGEHRTVGRLDQDTGVAEAGDAHPLTLAAHLGRRAWCHNEGAVRHRPFTPASGE